MNDMSASFLNAELAGCWGVAKEVLMHPDMALNENAPASTPSQPPAPRLLYDRKEAARQLSISVRSLDYLIAGKQFNTPPDWQEGLDPAQ